MKIKSKNILQFWALNTILFFGFACATPLTFLAPDYASLKPACIAVLPAINETADADAPNIFRILAMAELADKGYKLVEIDRIDEALKEKGIHEGWQIEALTAQEIGKLVGADGLLYIRVMSFGRQIGVHLRMEGSFSLVDAKTGEKIWYSELSAADDIVLEGGMVLLGAELMAGKDKQKKATAAYLAYRKARIDRAVAKFRAHPLRQQIFQFIKLDMDKIPLLDDFFSRNFRTLPSA
ncbi:MAG: GNA1162 family protein [Thermodesulfobacteriota bacterium]